LRILLGFERGILDAAAGAAATALELAQLAARIPRERLVGPDASSSS
jgi:hypothetical protein